MLTNKYLAVATELVPGGTHAHSALPNCGYPRKKKKMTWPRRRTPHRQRRSGSRRQKKRPRKTGRMISTQQLREVYKETPVATLPADRTCQGWDTNTPQKRTDRKKNLNTRVRRNTQNQQIRLRELLLELGVNSGGRGAEAGGFLVVMLRIYAWVGVLIVAGDFAWWCRSRNCCLEVWSEVTVLIFAGNCCWEWGRSKNWCWGFLPGVGVLIVAGDVCWWEVRSRKSCWGVWAWSGHVDLRWGILLGMGSQ